MVAVGHSFAARGGMEVFDRVRPGGVIQVGDHAGGLGVRHKRDLRPAAVRADQSQAGGQTTKRPAPDRGSGGSCRGGGEGASAGAVAEGVVDAFD